LWKLEGVPTPQIAGAYATSAFLIERALDQMRADAWPDVIEDVPAAHWPKYASVLYF
jgi:hypothetical protein